MQSVDTLRKKFIDTFPLAAEYSSQTISYSLEVLPLHYYLNNENIATGKPKEKFDSRKTKIHDDDYQTLFDQLVTEWETETDLHVYDKKVIETPRGATKEGRIDKKADEQFFYTPMDEDDEMEKPAIYSIADLKTFKLVKHDKQQLSDIEEDEV